MEVPKLQKALQILSDNPETVDTARAVASSLESPPPYPLTFMLSPLRGGEENVFGVVKESVGGMLGPWRIVDP